MISFLVGIIEEKSENILQLNVQGVGFELNISSNTFSALPQVGETIKIWSYLQVKEDGMALFGFSSKEERDLFLKLITISGVGPKIAIGILSGMKISELVTAIIRQDIALLSKIKGLGKKSAERICLELKDKIGSDNLLLDEPNISIEYNENAVNDATETLISLGVNRNESYKLARRCASEDSTAEEIIMKALRELGH
ncbi:MAG: Holliday junction branch migration protein RuvA [Clostridia bacterium]|nr:Holliday junction branch migration protein RuvA [Clostridia bacterium]